MVIYAESARCGDWHKTWGCRAGQRKNQVFLCPQMLKICSAPCAYSGTWRTQLSGWVSKSEERHPDHSGEAETQVTLRVQFGLLQLPSPRADCPGNEAIPEHGVPGTPRWVCANDNRELLSWNLRLPFPCKWDRRNCCSSIQEDPNIPS